MTDSSVSAALMPSRVHARSTVEVIDGAIQLVREHYATLVSVSAVALLPLLLVAPVADRLPRLVINLLWTVCSAYGEGCLIIAIAAVYTGNPLPSVPTLLRAGNRVFGRVLAIIFTRNVATGLGLILLIVPGLFFYAYYMLAAPVAVLEGLSVRPAIKRGGALAKGEYGRLIKVALLTGLIYLMLFFGAGVAIALVTKSGSMATLATMVVQILVLPAFVAITVLLYYDIRERREGFDIELALGTTAAPSPA
ncbi:MAG TPA: hypothetical protein VGG78_03865 [Gemmatimonadaceae bacterium]|jgi:hypothetical protein